MELIFLFENIFKDDINNFFSSSKIVTFKKLQYQLNELIS